MRDWNLPLAAAAVLAASASLIGGCGNDPNGGNEAMETDAADADGSADSSDGDSDGATEGTGGTTPGGSALDDPRGMGAIELRRLTRAELHGTLRRALQEDADTLTALLERLPADSATPFDNDVSTQTPSAPLIDGLLSVAESLSESLTDDPARMQAVWGCIPEAPNDGTCLREGAAQLGRRLLRRPLTPPELDDYEAFLPFAQAEGDFAVAVALVLQSLLLDAEFLYRVEVGEPIEEGLVRLSDHELAARLAFSLWGEGPDDALLDRVESGGLDAAPGLEETVQSMLADPRTLGQVQRLHALWLGYENLPIGGPLGDSLRTETDKLIERALTERTWVSVFESESTWLDANLAEHYGIELPNGEAGWVDYPDLRRGGLLSHGTFLALGKKFSDTSPTERGKAVWTRLLCRDMPPPPPDVDSGVPPTGGPIDACKQERYDMRDKTECAACHEILDSIGFGLENYGPAGEWRVREPGRDDCGIAGEGSLSGSEPFAGAAALGSLLVETGDLEGCFMQNVYQFAVGRPVTEDDAAVVAAMADRFEDQDDFIELLRAFTTSEAFRHRVLPEEN